MIIYGTKGKQKTIGRGYFYCPRCRTRRPYEHKRISKYFSLYFIPIIPIKNMGEYIECQFCFTPFETSVLELSAPETDEMVRKFINDVKSKLDKGIPLQGLIQSLLEDGASEDVAKTVIAVVSGGKINVCEACELHYLSSVNYCPECGKALSKIA